MPSGGSADDRGKAAGSRISEIAAASAFSIVLSMGPALSPNKLLDAVSRVETSGRLGAKARATTILRYIVEEEIAGRGDRISGYSIGVDVLDRPQDFDPGTDSIVRTEMARLRKALELYYSSDGTEDPIRLDIPKGTYRLQATHAPRSTRKHLVLVAAAGLVVTLLGIAGWAINRETQTASVEPFSGPVLQVRPFEARPPGGVLDAIASGFTFELITDLTQYSWIAISRLTHDANPTVEADFVLEGEMSIVNDVLVLTASLSTAAESQVIWTHRQERGFNSKDIAAVQRDFALALSEQLAERQGVVPSLLLSHRTPLDAVAVENFSCFMSIHAYWEDPTEAEHTRLRECLTETVERSADYAEAWAALSFIHMDEGREGFNRRPETDPWQAAEQAVKRALELEPLSSLVLNAAMTFAVARPEPDLREFREYGERELKMRPNSAYTLANFGGKLALNAGDWKQGMLLHARALELDKSPPGWMFFAPAYEELLFGTDRDLARATALLTARGSAAVELLRAISARKQGDIAALDESLAYLKANDIDARGSAVSYVRGRRFTPALERKLIEEIGRIEFR